MSYTLIPNTGQSLGQTRDPIRTNFTVLDTTIAVNHIAMNTVGAGKHKFVQMPAQGSDPATAVGEIATYSKLVGGLDRLFLRQENSGTVIQLSNIDPLIASNGYTFLPGGLLLQWGSFLSTASSPISYPIAFTTVYQVIGSNNSNDRNLGIGVPGNTSFPFLINNPLASVICRWFAIGTK